MIKIKSVSGFTCFVKNLNKTAAFYETLGFEIRKREAKTKPQDQPWGNREFMLHDPDGYHLVIFKRK
jgi:catechol 2,3-dioxygenase-like lactoylglutathione lyase family enzyme